MLQVTRRILSLTRGDEVEGQPRPRQKVMTSRGSGSRDKLSRQEPCSRQGRENGRPWENAAPRAPMEVRCQGRIGSTRSEGNGYKNGLDFIITLVVVNFNSSSLTQIDTSYSIYNRIGLSIFG